jgi:hypothetical protein
MDASALEPSRWNLIFELLSLDGIVALYEEMGLKIPDKQRFARMLRRLMAETRQTYGPDRTPDIRLAEKVLKEIEAVFGKQTAEHFYKWATTVFYWVHSFQPQWSAWDSILPRHPAQLHKNLSSERWDDVAQFRKAHSTEDLEQQVRLLRTRPLSAWDTEAYLLYRYSNNEDPLCERDFIDPYSPILSTIEMNRFQLAWPKLWSQFTEDEKNLLWNYGRQFLKDEEIEMPERLRHPDELRRQI